MNAKQIARRALQVPAVMAALRWVNTNPVLSEDSRHQMYVKVTKKVPPNPEMDFTYRLLDRYDIEFMFDGTLRELYWTGAFEANSLPVFVRYAEQAQVVLDVGAADGMYSLFTAAVNPTASILAFEPGVRQKERLAHNIEANRSFVGDRIRVVDIALTDHDGTALFHETASEGDSSLNAEFRPSSEGRTVQVAKGDTLLPELIGDSRVDLIKIDTESTEPDVLRGLAGTVQRDRPVILCEVLSGRTEPQLQELVDAWDYRTWWLGPEGPVQRDAIVGDPNNRYVNWLFLPDDRAALRADPT